MGDELYSLQVWIEYFPGSGDNKFHSDAVDTAPASCGVQKCQVRRGLWLGTPSSMAWPC